ncbi:MAG: DUF3019 domain-containing protein [Alteromonadaceae bacterium]|nr:DUF3019 domain-containing protein [Alteromonadaceae bacterium]
MDSHKKNKAFYLLFLLCFCTTLFAANKTILPITAKLASMVASPNSCTVEVEQEVCEMTFHILWQTPTKGDYCLHSKEGIKPLKCWYKADHGTIKLDFFAHVLANNKHYVLLDAQGDHLIASVDVPVIGTLKQRQRAQRRRRGFWRMF